MRKSLFVLGAIALALVGCGKETPVDNGGGENGGNETPKGEFSLVSEAAINVPTEGDIIKVEFTSTVDWTASLDVTNDVASLNVKSGAATDNSVKVTVMKFEEKNATRTITLTLTPEGLDPVQVVLTQEGVFEPYFTVDVEELEIAAAGGEVTFTISTNVEFDVTKYDEFEAWAPFTLDDKTGKFTVAANTEYGPRQAYVKFTVPSIQVPVYDDEGNDTGETQDMPVRVYVNQAGKASIAWSQIIPESYRSAWTDDTKAVAEYSIAYFGGMILVCNGTDIYMANAATGADLGKLDLGGTAVKTICNDDAGNLLLGVGGQYGANFVALVMSSDGQKQNTIIAWPVGYYGYGVAKLAAKGDIFDDGVVTAFVGGPPTYGGVNKCLYWEFTDGATALSKLDESVSDEEATWITRPIAIAPDCLAAKDVWRSYDCFFVPAGAAVSDGFYYGGYDGQYQMLYYNPSDSSWSTAFPSGSTWEWGLNTFSSVEWNGETYSATIEMSYFPRWAITSNLFLNKGKGTLTNLAKFSYTGFETYDESTEPRPQCTSVLLRVEGENLACYVVDGSWLNMTKYVLTK